MKIPIHPEPVGKLSTASFDDQLVGWLGALSENVPALGDLLGASPSHQVDRGYYHTLREISQQPLTWTGTADRAVSSSNILRESLHGVRHIVLTGSGSSHYSAECLAFRLQTALGVSAQSISSGQLLTHGDQVFPPAAPALLISLARSGDSPESYAVVESVLNRQLASRHLIITCNEEGRLSQSFSANPRVRTLTLAPETCDRSLVMTSSFTNMIVAGWALAELNSLPDYRAAVNSLSCAGAELLLDHAAALAATVRQPFTSVVYLGSGDRLGAAHECALKMVESTAGRVRTFAETYLGLRHGPMSAVREDSIVVCLLSGDEHVRRYEIDLIAELNRKRIGAARIIVGSSIPPGVARAGDLPIEIPALPIDSYATVLDVMVGQLLAFFRCLHEGLHPDSPSSDGIINRVVEEFPIYLGGSENGT